MEIDVSQYSSRAKEGKASWCVDTRSLVHNGKQEFFKTKAEAKAYKSLTMARSSALTCWRKNVTLDALLS